jgi:hypothetical protein
MNILKTVLSRVARLALLLVFAGMGLATNLWADQCSGGLVGTATGCGALITVLQVDDAGNATAFTVTTLGNGNPYDGTEDTLVGIVNSASGSLKSITLSSPDTTFGGLFNFDADGPCSFNSGDCFNGAMPGVDPGDYQGPNNTFVVGAGTPCGVDLTCHTSGVVNFNTPILHGGSTWFAIEGTPTSFGQISQTQTIEPGVTTVYPIGNDNYKITPFNNLGGELLTITAFLVPKASFVPPNGFSTESCIPYADFSGVQDTCVEIHQTCAQGSASSNDCDTFLYQMMTNYDLPTDLALTGIGGPDFLYFQNQSCPTTAASTAQSVFLSYNVNRFDPVTRGGSNPTNGCFIATYTVGATPITSGGTSTFVGFQSPVSNTALNIVKAGSTVPLKWVQLDNLGNPVIIPNLSLCTALSYPVCTAPAGISAPWVFVQAYAVPGTLCTADLAVGTDTLLTTATGGSGLQNLSTTQPGLYQYNWKTPSGTPKGTCAEITFTYSSGAFLVTPPEFQFK